MIDNVLKTKMDKNLEFQCQVATKFSNILLKMLEVVLPSPQLSNTLTSISLQDDVERMRDALDFYKKYLEYQQQEQDHNIVGPRTLFDQKVSTCIQTIRGYLNECLIDFIKETQKFLVTLCKIMKICEFAQEDLLTFFLNLLEIIQQTDDIIESNQKVENTIVFKRDQFLKQIEVELLKFIESIKKFNKENVVTIENAKNSFFDTNSKKTSVSISSFGSIDVQDVDLQKIKSALIELKQVFAVSKPLEILRDHINEACKEILEIENPIGQKQLILEKSFSLKKTLTMAITCVKDMELKQQIFKELANTLKNLNPKSNQSASEELTGSIVIKM